jgi:hypothetical protein
MGAVGPLMLKIIKQMTDERVASMALVTMAEIDQNLFLECAVALAVAYSTQYLECSELFGHIVATTTSVS